MAGSNFGSPSSRACAIVIDCTPASVHIGLKVLFAHTAIAIAQTPFTTPSASHVGSPSAQTMLRG